jgi:tetratricopeptide (TPR) repeat protein
MVCFGKDWAREANMKTYFCKNVILFLSFISLGSLVRAQEKETKKPVLEYKEFIQAPAVDLKETELFKAKRKAAREQMAGTPIDKADPELLLHLAANYSQEAAAPYHQAKEEKDKWRLRSIDLYQRIITNFPQYKQRDEALFLLADSFWILDRRKDALSAYKSLIKDYPDSSYLPHAYLMFAEFYFEAAKYQTALTAYKKTAEHKEARTYPFALYKQGWVYYLLRDYEKAQDMFDSVVMFLDQQKLNQGEWAILRKQASQDSAMVQTKGAR